MALGTAACVAGNDPVKMLRLPFTEGMVNRVIIPRTQRFAYDQAVRMIGCHIVEIDTREELDRALEEPVAMVVLLGKQEHLCPVRLEEFAAIMKPRGIPIMVDAASEHLERPSPWLARGADLVIYSGGKFLRGPQTSGLLLGSKRLVEAAWRNASPHQALGRPMKVSKEDIIGVLAAVEYWFEERDRGAERQKWYDDLAIIAERVGADAWRRERDRRAGGRRSGAAAARLVGPRRVPDRRARAAPAGARRRAARSCSTTTRRPRTRSRSTRSSSQPGEAAAVGDAIVAALLTPRAGTRSSRRTRSGRGRDRRRLGNARRVSARRPHPPARIEQRGAELAGHQRSAGFEGPVSGALRGNAVRLAFSGHYEGSTISYLFDGEIRDGRMSGTALLGAASDQNAGIVNQSQFGAGSWQAQRVG